MNLYLNMSPHDEMTTVIIGLTVIITENKFIKFPKYYTNRIQAPGIYYVNLSV